MLLTSCGQKQPAGTNSNSPTPTPTKSESVSRYKEVFDTSQDAGNLVVRFLATKTTSDTKAGDSTIIKTPDGKVMLIDASAPETWQTIEKYLKDLGIKKIDAIVASHPHVDHVGGLAQVIKDFEVGKVYRSKVDYPSNTNKDFLKAVEDKKIETVILKDGMSFDFGNTKVDVYSPTDDIQYPSTFPDNSTAFLNDHSLVLKMTYKDSTVLLPGDLYAAGESNLLERHAKDIQADILKIPHHGADTSSTIPFIEAVKPKVAVAEYDELASLSTYNSYRKRNSLVYITAVDGNVKVTANGTKDYKVVTEKDRTSDTLK
jgi:competence protein ComEC